MVIDGICLNVIINTLLNLVAYVRAEYKRVQRISQKLAKWPGMLQKIHAVTHDAEKRQMNGDSAVYLWLAELREVAYDMEDVLDGLAAEARKKALKLPGVLSIQQMKGEVDEIDSRLGEIFMQVSLLHLNENSELQSSSSHGRSSSNVQVPTSLPEPGFFGREKEMEELILRLTGIDEDDNHVANYTVIPIVGMGGVGKTALAQQLYNHKEVREAFVFRAWAHVSDDFDSIAITKSILETIAPLVSCEGKDLNWLQVTLMGQLSQKKFLIVLDDVWNENYSELNSLLNPFHSGSRGSRVLLTTRSLKVATQVGDPTMLSFLDADQCLPVLAYHAIGKENFNTRPHLEEVAAQLAEKCKGLPLAAKTIGGLLRAEDRVHKWREILDQGIWNSYRETNSIPAALKLSYVHLPVHLKRCFVTCALFPKGYVFDREELVRLWIAQGLLLKEKSQTYREVGIDYFHELEARSFFQRASKETLWFSMHDLNNDLAKSVVGDAYFSSVEGSKLADEDSLGKARHGSIVVGKWERLSASRLDVYRSMKKLRTFVPLQISPHYGPNVFVSKTAMQNLLTGLKCLRELSLRYFRIIEVPKEISELKLLRSLDFSYTLIAVLPETICDLVNLKILLVRGCKSLAALPANIHRLINLLHLDICNTSSLKEMPPRIGELANLEILSKFVVGKKAGQELKELGQFKHLQRELRIFDLREAKSIADARTADLRSKHGLTHLCLNWAMEDEILQDHAHQLKLLELLQPPKEIQQLKMWYYGGKRLPSWCGTQFIDNITSITLGNCRYVECLPPFGQLPSLQQLYLVDLDAVRKIGAEFYGNGRPFQSLRALFFYDMVAWEEWSSCEGFKEEHPFSCLRELVVQNCPKLNRGLPRRLDSLAELTISDCPLLTMSEATLSLPSLLNLWFENSNVGLLASFVDIVSLAKITITRVQPLPSFDRRFVASWVALENLEITDCDHLVRLSDDICCLVSLEGCANLSDFNSTRLPPNLTSLSIFSCKNLQFLPMELMIPRDPLSCQLVGINLDGRSNEMLETCHLTDLILVDCPSIEPSQFHHMTLPPTLKNLHIERCKGLESLAFLVADVHHSQSLQELRIRSCENFKRLPDKLPHLINLNSLEVDDCRDLELECFPPLPHNLSTFQLLECPKVKSLPHDMHNLTSLKELAIWSISMTCLPKGGLPPNLESLSIGFCKKLKTPLPEWGLHGLTALLTLEIGGGMECVDGMVCFPSADPGAWAHLLPSSLVNLSISGVASIERLVGGLRTRLTSLEELVVTHCPKLRYLPDDGLPASLVCLRIQHCELLKQRCSEPKGRYWPVIQLIPDVRFEEELKFTEALPPPDS